MIDYECIKDNKGQRLVAFGRYAGIAGAVDFFRGIGEFLLEKKVSTPFVSMGSTYMYPDYEEIKIALKRLASNITKKGIAKKLGPAIFAVTGTGRVAQGAIEVL
jgi:alpha-aminoadipic semialdehyde synthase